jgi:hypothetical protein
METVEELHGDKYKTLFALPRPRHVRIKTGPRIILGALPIASAVVIYFSAAEISTWSRIGNHFSFQNGAARQLIVAMILVAAGCLTFWRVDRDRKLMREGELAVGTVTHQKLVLVHGGRGGPRKQSSIRYRFKDASGELFQGTGTDYSSRLAVSMTVPVFYDPANPEKNVTFCTAMCEFSSD